MKTLLIVFHSLTGGTRQMAEAALHGAASGPLRQNTSASYRNTLNDANIGVPEQQRAAAADNKHAGGKPKASPDQMGVQPDEARSQREKQLRQQSAGR